MADAGAALQVVTRVHGQATAALAGERFLDLLGRDRRGRGGECEREQSEQGPLEANPPHSALLGGQSGAGGLAHVLTPAGTVYYAHALVDDGPKRTN